MAWLVELQAIIQGNYIHSTILTLFRRSKASQDQLTEFIRPQTTDDYPLTAPYTVFQMVHMCFTCSEFDRRCGSGISVNYIIIVRMRN